MGILDAGRIHPMEQVVAGEMRMRKVTIYRDDSTSQVVYNDVKHIFWTANNTVLVIAHYRKPGSKAHYYVHWPREKICWFKDEPK